jgi:hypothetical protein
MKARCAGACVLPRASFGAGGHGRGGNSHRQTSTCSRPRHVAVIVLRVPTGLLGKGWCTAGPPSRCPGTPGDAGRPLGAAASHPPVHAGGTDAGGFNAPIPGPITTDLPPRSPTRPGRSRGGRARPPIRRTTPSGSWPARRADRALPFGAPASFGYTGVQRALAGDVMDVMLTLRANSAPGNGVAPDPALIRGRFPVPRPDSRMVGQSTGGPDQMTATESFDAGIAARSGITPMPCGYRRLRPDRDLRDIRAGR